MSIFATFFLLGIAAGAVYALAAQGVVVIYRGSGVLNFAHGAIALLAAGAYVELTQSDGWAVVPAVITAILLSALLGYLVEFLVMRRLRGASPLARLVAILAVLGVVQSVAILRYGSNFILVQTFLPSSPLSLGNGIVLSEDRPILLGIAAVITIALWWVYRYTAFGRATTAAAENPRTAAAAGVSPNFVAAANWAIGGALAGAAGVLIVPITSLDPTTLTLLIIPALAAAMLGGFRSFPLTFVGGVAIGIGESLLGHYVTAAGWAESLPFLIIIAVVVFRGRALPVRGYIADRLPAVGMAPVNWWFVAFGTGLGFLAVFTLSVNAVNALTAMFIAALVCLSVVVVTGLAGQLSLGQLAFAGIGAFVSSRLAQSAGLGFGPALVCGVAVAVVAGLLFALPALRTRGVNLAIVTLGLAYAIDNIVLLSPAYTGGYQGIVVRPAELFGYDLNDITHPRRYASVALLLFLLCGLAVARLRGGRAGRRLLATRANERAAASLGISTTGAKLFAFALAAAIASLSGVLSAFQYPNVSFIGYDPISSIQLVLITFLGGVGYVTGAGFAGAIAAGGLLTYAISTLINFNQYEALVTSAAVILMLLQNPDGVVRLYIRLLDRLRVRAALEAVPWAGLGRLRRDDGERRAAARQSAGVREETGTPPRCTPRSLHVEDLTVRFGGVVALSGVSVTVGPGKVLGLIGPNGAGKTTMIDAITGYNRIAAGRVLLDEVDLRRLPAYRRARAGIARTFQSVELFEDMTVGDNLRAACDTGKRSAYLADLVRPRAVPLPAHARRAIEEFGLAADLGRRPIELSFGKRRLLGIARAIASGPSILLLDEPAAGLDETETAELGGVIRRLADDWGIGVLLIEHDMSLVTQVCDRVAVLNFGEKISEGSPEEVRRDDLVMSAYLGEEDAAGVTAADGTEPSAAPVGDR
jgi:sulfate-transporting ATPase